MSDSEESVKFPTQVAADLYEISRATSGNPNEHAAALQQYRDETRLLPSSARRVEQGIRAAQYLADGRVTITEIKD